MTLKVAVFALSAVVLLCFLGVESQRPREEGEGRGRGRGGRPSFLPRRLESRGGQIGRGLQAWRRRLAERRRGPIGGVSEEAQTRPRPSLGRTQGSRGLVGGAVRGLLGFGGQRLPGFSGGRGRGPQRPRDTDTSGGFSGFVPEGALKAAWNRALAGRQVAESGWSWNSSDVTVALIRSRDPQLREVSFTGAATLYTFRENDTLVTVRPGFRPAGSTCFLLPPSTVTFSQTEDKLSARNNTVLGAPTSVVKLNGTGGRLSPSEIADEFRDNPSLLFFCGFSGVVRLSLADEAAFPASGETDRARVLKMVTLDTELNILVPKRVGNARFFGNRRRLAAARRARDRMSLITQVFEGLTGQNTI